MGTPGVIDLRPQDLEALRAVPQKFPSVKSVRIFGSRVTGDARHASDIDLAVEASGMPGQEWAALFEAIEEAPLIYSIDVVRMENLPRGPLLTAIRRDGVFLPAA